MLTKSQIDTYAHDGFVVVPKVISNNKLKAMQADLDIWIEESKI